MTVPSNAGSKKHMQTIKIHSIQRRIHRAFRAYKHTLTERSEHDRTLPKAKSKQKAYANDQDS
jgi:hypothetical protein